MKAFEILSRLSTGGFLPSFIIFKTGKMVLENCKSCPKVYSVESGSVKPEARYLLVLDKVITAFAKAIGDENFFVYKFAGDTYFAFEIEE